MNTQEIVEDIVSKIRTGCPKLVYITEHRVNSCDMDSEKANRILSEHQSVVIGIYDRKVKPVELREDIEYRMRYLR